MCVYIFLYIYLYHTHLYTVYTATIPNMLMIACTGLAELTELIFFTAALKVLCFVLADRKVLVTHQCLAIAKQCQHNVNTVSLKFLLTSRLALGKIVGGDTGTQLTQSDSHTIRYLLSNTSQKKRGGGRQCEMRRGHSLFMTCLLEQTLCMLKPHFPRSG